RGSLRKIVHEHHAHISKKLNIYEESISKAIKGLGYRKMGELITANLYRIPQGVSEAILEDYTDPEYKPVTVKLNPSLNGIDNSQKYFKLYNKAKATIKKATPFKDSALEEINYLQTILISIDQASNTEELKEIHNELIEQHYLKGKQPEISLKSKAKINPNKIPKAKKRQPEEQSRPHIYYSKTNCKVIVGRNNKQNDKMTWRESAPGDMWLHVKEIPGSHVIVPLKNEEEFPDDETLLDAATLAIYFSQARGSSNVAVDYTHVKQIKKPNGAKPGMVVYEQNWSLYLTPKQEDIDRLLTSESEEE
ncbi:MAG: NFACT RNA binding domain-containing protein, partial [Eubacteriales bacterium]